MPATFSLWHRLNIAGMARLCPRVLLQIVGPKLVLGVPDAPLG